MEQDHRFVFQVTLAHSDPAGGDVEDAMWTHLRLEPDGAPVLVDEYGLSSELADALVVEGARPRLAAAEGGLIVVLRGVNCSPGADPEDMVSIRGWLDGSRLITVSPRRVYAAQDVRDAIESAEEPWTAGDALAAVADQLVERMRPILSELDEVVDDMMEQLLAGQAADLQRPLGALRHKLAALRRHMAPQRDALRELGRSSAKGLTETNKVGLQHVADRQLRYVEDLDALRERAGVLQDELHSAVATVLNRNTYVLSIVAAVCLPIGLLTGLLGINVGGIPGTESPAAFWVVCGLLVAIVAVEVWYLKRRRMF